MSFFAFASQMLNELVETVLVALFLLLKVHRNVPGYIECWQGRIPNRMRATQSMQRWSGIG